MDRKQVEQQINPQKAFKRNVYVISRDPLDSSTVAYDFQKRAHCI